MVTNISSRILHSNSETEITEQELAGLKQNWDEGDKKFQESLEKIKAIGIPKNETHPPSLWANRLKYYQWTIIGGIVGTLAIGSIAKMFTAWSLLRLLNCSLSGMLSGALIGSQIDKR
jgi:hypothetical protein